MVSAACILINELSGKLANYYIETKSPEVYPGMEEELLSILKDNKMLGEHASSGKVMIQSFSKESLLKVHKLSPEIPLVQLLWYQPDATGKMVEETGITSSPNEVTKEELKAIHQYAVGIGMNYRYNDEIFLNKDFVSKARSLHMLVHPFTVNMEEDMKTLLDWGVTGMFTNFSGKLVDVYHDYKKHEHNGIDR
jgi:glycerophosphoryl diester phosphodiesterase